MRGGLWDLIAVATGALGLSVCPLEIRAQDAVRTLQVIKDVTAAGIVDRAVVVAKDGFTFDSVNSYCRNFWETHRGSSNVLRLTIGTDPFEVAASLYKQVPGATIEEAYAAVADRFAREPVVATPIARLMALGDRALVSYRDQAGVRNLLLGGSTDPTRFRHRDSEFHVLHFSTEGRPDAPSSYVVRFYATAKPDIRLRDCISLLRDLQKLTLLERTEVSVAQQPWFVADSQYPAVYPFESGLTLPSLLQVKIARWAFCSAESRGVRCSGRGFEP